MITIVTFVLIGISAYTFSRILMDADMIFGFYYKLLEKLPAWLAKPLGMCEYCLAGQLAFWYYLVKYFDSYCIVNHILYTSLAIFTVEIINIYTARNGN